MKSFIVNVGIGRHTPDDVKNVIPLQSFRVLPGTSDWGDEPTLVGVVSADEKHISGILQAACSALGEDCIAFRDQDSLKGGMVFNPEYTGERFEFNPDYFLI